MSAVLWFGTAGYIVLAIGGLAGALLWRNPMLLPLGVFAANYALLRSLVDVGQLEVASARIWTSFLAWLVILWLIPVMSWRGGR